MSLSSKAENRSIGSRSLPTRRRQGGSSEDPLVLSPVNAGRLSPAIEVGAGAGAGPNGDGVATTEPMTMKKLRELEKSLGIDEEKVCVCVRAWVHHSYVHFGKCFSSKLILTLPPRARACCGGVPINPTPFLPQVREVSGAERALASEMRLGISETHQVFVEVRVSIDPVKILAACFRVFGGVALLSGRQTTYQRQTDVPSVQHSSMPA